MSKPQGNPYKVLYWMGGGLLLLMLGVVALVLLRPTQPREVPEHERTLLWLYDSADPTGSGVAALLEETPAEGRLVAVSFPAPPEARAVFMQKERAKQAQAEVAELAGRQVHHRVFLPFPVIEVLIKATGGITVDGQGMDPAAAIAYITEDELEGPTRALKVMLAVSDAAMYQQFTMGAGEALRLAGQIETDLDLVKIPEVLQRWSTYDDLQLLSVAALNPEAVDQFLQPDPVAANQ